MPTYEFINTETDEYFEKFMSFSARDEFLKENPHIQQTMTKAPGIVSGVSTSTQNRVPDGFKEVLSKISENNRGSAVAEKHGRKGIKEAKTAQVVQKHIDRVAKRDANKK